MFWDRAQGLTLVLGLLLGTSAAVGAPKVGLRAPGERGMARIDEASLVEQLVSQHGEAQRSRAVRGVHQVALLWRPETDGSAEAFVREQFVAGTKELDETFARLEWVLEEVEGHLVEAIRALRWASDVDGPSEPIDALLAAVNPASHLNEELFASKVAFAALLNFPLTTLAERLRDGASYDRRRWAEVRLTGRFRDRVPGSVRQKQTEARARAERYVNEYNIYLHHALDADGHRLFPKGTRLLSHWNLRDQIKADYARPDGPARQRLVLQVMERIVAQAIPAAVINDPTVDWNVATGQVSIAPLAEVEEGRKRTTPPSIGREFDTRYEHVLEQFHTELLADPYSPTAPNALARAFEGAELPEDRLTAMLAQVLESPVAAKVAREIARRLGRPLEPLDLWYDGFNARATISEDALTRLTHERYANADAFARDIPRILGQLGFAEAKARFIAEHIRVDAARGAGHALGVGRRGDFPRLRTRVGPQGMDYKGYNIAVHELGHNVEQVLSIYEVDHNLLAGVPNTAFTEALAFVFQGRDLELLGQAKRDTESERLGILNAFWQTWEIAGVALVDLSMWRWLYAHPDATPAQLREAVVHSAREIWNRYYAPLLGGKDTPLLAVYSHAIANPLYLFNYPLGHLIAFQVEEFLRANRSRPLGVEFERMARMGAVTPDVWMQNATGAPVSAEPLLEATSRALAAPH